VLRDGWEALTPGPDSNERNNRDEALGARKEGLSAAATRGVVRTRRATLRSRERLSHNGCPCVTGAQTLV
jgi:hypothetical protein